MESLLLHAELLPREWDGLFPHARLLLHGGARDLPRSSAALRLVAGPVGNEAADSPHGAGLSRCSKSDGGGRGGAQEDCAACGKSAVAGEPDVEAMAAAVPLQPRPALSVEGKRIISNNGRLVSTRIQGHVGAWSEFPVVFFTKNKRKKTQNKRLPLFTICHH